MSKRSPKPPALPWLAPRAVDSHKGDYGKALLIGGSRGMSGAIGLAGMAALRSGAGLVTVAVPDSAFTAVASYEPSYMALPLPSDPQGRLSVAGRDQLAELAEEMTCLAVGPGMGRSKQVTELVTWMYEVLPQPIVFDADALFGLAQHVRRLDDPAGPRILTPHPGEFRRFIEGAELDPKQFEQMAIHFAQARGLVMVLKGHRSLVTDGRKSTYNKTGNPGMATGGSGDVLTGIITALVCQGLSPFEAAQLGAHVHGAAGDLAAEEFGQVSLIASDLVQFLPYAFRRLES